MSIEHPKGPVEDQVVKARFVALGNVLFTMHGQVVKNLNGCFSEAFFVVDDSSEVCGSRSRHGRQQRSTK